eukprot:scaffold154852_cov13-Tisochrysis_lutea.AAC.1
MEAPSVSPPASFTIPSSCLYPPSSMSCALQHAGSSKKRKSSSTTYKRNKDEPVRLSDFLRS